MTPDAWLVGSGYFTGLCGLAGIIFTTVQSRRASHGNTEVEADRTAVEGFRGLVESLQAEVKRLSDRVEQIEKRAEAAERAREVAERARDEAQRVSHAALAYIQKLLGYIADHLPGRTDVPPRPRDLYDHLAPSEDWRLPPTDTEAPK